jgi:hypothetical protein
MRTHFLTLMILCATAIGSACAEGSNATAEIPAGASNTPAGGSDKADESVERGRSEVSGEASAKVEALPTTTTKAASGPLVPPSPDVVCATVRAAAAEHGLPPAFFTRLIWQESRFKTHVVSRAGAQGVAQFMPGTAAWRGLRDPFDPAPALAESAQWLRELRGQFGNLGLAAAAYNAGPQRVRDWMAGKRTLPRETRDYVTVITGRSADQWVAAAIEDEALLPEISCSQVARALALPRGRGTTPGEAKPGRPHLPWGVQIAGNFSEQQALAAFQRARQRFASLLSTDPVVVRRRTAGRAVMHTIRIAAETRQGAEQLCSRLRAAGGACLVLRN